MARLKQSKRKKTPEQQQDEQALKLIAAILTDPASSQRQLVLQEVLRSGQPGEHRALAAHLIKHLVAGDAAVQRLAGVTLAALGEPAFHALYLHLLSGPAPVQQVPLLEALGLVGRGLPDPAQTAVLALLFRLFPFTRERPVLHALAEAVALIREAEAAQEANTKASRLPALDPEPSPAPGASMPA